MRLQLLLTCDAPLNVSVGFRIAPVAALNLSNFERAAPRNLSPKAHRTDDHTAKYHAPATSAPPSKNNDELPLQRLKSRSEIKTTQAEREKRQR